MKVQDNGVPVASLESQEKEIAVATGKIEPSSNRLAAPQLAPKRESATVFREKTKNARKTRSPRTLDHQKNAEVGVDREISLHGSQLPDLAGAEELFASLRPVPANYEKVGPQRVLGVLTSPSGDCSAATRDRRKGKRAPSIKEHGKRPD